MYECAALTQHWAKQLTAANPGERPSTREAVDRNGRRSDALVASTAWIPLPTRRRPCGPPFHSNSSSLPFSVLPPRPFQPNNLFFFETAYRRRDGLSDGVLHTPGDDQQDHGGLNCAYKTLAGVARARRLRAGYRERPIRFTCKGIRPDERVALAVGRVRTSCAAMWTCSRHHRAQKLAAERPRSRWSIYVLLLGLTQVCMHIQNECM